MVFILMLALIPTMPQMDSQQWEPVHIVQMTPFQL